MKSIIISGKVATNPILEDCNDGKGLCAVFELTNKDGKYSLPETYTIICKGPQVDFVNQYVKKGMRIIASGSFSLAPEFVVIANNVEFCG